MKELDKSYKQVYNVYIDWSKRITYQTESEYARDDDTLPQAASHQSVSSFFIKAFQSRKIYKPFSDLVAPIWNPPTWTTFSPLATIRASMRTLCTTYYRFQKPPISDRWFFDFKFISSFIVRRVSC